MSTELIQETFGKERKKFSTYITLIQFLILVGLYFESSGFAEVSHDDWMAAYHQTLVAVDAQRPNASVGTYINDRFTFVETYQLAKIFSGIEINGQKFEAKDANNIKVMPIPGGVVASYTLGKVKVNTEIVPLLRGRDEIEWQGAALYTICTEPAAMVTVKCGEGEMAQFPAKEKVVFLRSDDIGIDGDTASIGTDGLGLLQSKKHVLNVCVSTSGKMTVQPGSQGGQILNIRMDSGSGNIVIAFAKDAERAKTLAKSDVQNARKEIDLHYKKLFQTRIETPEKVMDEAFRQALVTNEYVWFNPYGWMECIHHWVAMWHMQNAAGMAWCGQTDRAKASILSHVEKMKPDGTVMQIAPGGYSHRDFGGSNQYFAWQIRTYLDFTDDSQMREYLAPVLDKVIQKTYSEYDRDRNLLLAWGEQIGNQEDFIATPYDGSTTTIEGIRMMQTRALIAGRLGDVASAKKYETLISLAKSRLKEQLWLKDLGRFAYFKEPAWIMRLDGQYETFIYPAIYDITDPFDSYTGIRHLRDRLTGKDGEIYCSNNFPNHVGGTWGMQAGGAQQPWGAWGLAKVGLRNETYRPLKYISEYVMNNDHKGSWPEVAAEPIPAYFSPPSGLYIQAVVEALFGLRMNKPQGYLQVSPSLPDDWPYAKLNLPEFDVYYQRKGNTLDYTVESKEPIARRLRWMLPAGDITSVIVNGKKSEYKISAGVGCILLSVDTESQTKTHYTIKIDPLVSQNEYPRSIAEGDEITLKIPSCDIKAIDDRCGVLSQCRIENSHIISAKIQRDLLQPYLKYGRLGQMNFSRRTFFVLCRTDKGSEFWLPIDLTILPGYEAAAVDQVRPDGRLDILIRNNSASPLSGRAVLKAAQQFLVFDIDIPSRGEKQYEVKIHENVFSQFSPGENAAQLILPSGNSIDLTIIATNIFIGLEPMKKYSERRHITISLPENSLQKDELWLDWTDIYGAPHAPWSRNAPVLQGVAAGLNRVKGLDPVPFDIPDRKLVPISYKCGRPVFTLDLGGRECKKLYLLLASFTDNHDMFSPIAQIVVRERKTLNGQTESTGLVIRERTLYMPGDLDWWCPQSTPGGFWTAERDDNQRFTLLPILDSKAGDWQQAKPPAFPQPQYWAQCLAFRMPASVMNVVEIGFEKPEAMDSLSIYSVGTDSAVGLVAVTAETTGGMEKLAGTKYMPPAEFREPITIFDIKDVNSVRDWKFDSNTFSVAAIPTLFDKPTLNSLAKSGEAATGKAISPDFKALPDFKSLSIYCQGGNSAADESQGLLAVDLVDSKTGERLERLYIKGTHSLREEKMSLKKAAGKTVHLELLDMNANTSYAWLGLKSVLQE